MAIPPFNPITLRGSPTNNGTVGLETALDIQFAGTLARGANLTLWATDNWCKVVVVVLFD
jgi:subtilase family serine protease